MTMLPHYRIDAIDLEKLEAQLTCYLNDPADGIAFKASFVDLKGRYPEGVELDRLIRSRLPADMAARLQDKCATLHPGEEKGSTREHAHFVTAFGAMTHVTEGDEKIYQLRPLNRIRRFDMPVESY